MDQKRKIGLRFKQIRESLRLSQFEFADKIKPIHQTMVSKIERGEASPTIPVLQSVSELSGWSIDHILNGDQAITPKSMTLDSERLHKITQQLSTLTTEVEEIKTQLGLQKTA